MLQDIEYQYDDTYAIKEIAEGDYLIAIKDKKILFGENFSLPRYCDHFKGHSFTYLFRVGDNNFFYLDGEVKEDEEYRYQIFRRRLNVLPKWQEFALITGVQFARWYRNNRYCGCCGRKNRISDRERMFYCEHCQTMIYPRISPAVIVAVIDREKDRVIVTKRSEASKGMALISGFSEVGETVENTCHREVMEEVGVKIKNLRYYKSQPWPYSDSLLMGFTAELDGSDELHVDYSENTDAFWVERKDLGSSDL